VAKVEVCFPKFSGPNPTKKTRFFSFNRAQSRVVIGHPTGHNTLRRHLHLMGLTTSPLCRKCGTEEETSAHTLCECEAWLHSDINICAPLSWTQRTLSVQVWGPSGTLTMEQCCLDLVSVYGAQRARFKA